MIIDAYCRIRTIDNTIPDNVLDFIKDAAIEKLRKHDVKRTELPEVGCINSLGCACKEANGYPLTDCNYWQGN